MELIKLVVIGELLLSVSFAGSLIYLYVFYKKNNDKVDFLYSCLIDAGYMSYEDESLYKNLGFLGFGFRVSILKMIFRGKVFKSKKNRLFDAGATNLLIRKTNGDYGWIKSYYNIFKVQCVIAILLIVLTCTSDYLMV
jgi:hypothetical protein